MKKKEKDLGGEVVVVVVVVDVGDVGVDIVGGVGGEEEWDVK